MWGVTGAFLSFLHVEIEIEKKYSATETFQPSNEKTIIGEHTVNLATKTLGLSHSMGETETGSIYLLFFFWMKPATCLRGAKCNTGGIKQKKNMS